MLTGFLLGVGACYSGAMYYLFRHYLSDALDSKISFGGRLFSGAMFLAAPITAPLHLLVLIFVY